MKGVLKVGLCALPVLGGCLDKDTGKDDAFERLRQEAVNRPRTILWDDDGCDMSFYPFGRKDLADKTISPENFEAVFLDAVKGTKVDTITYSTVFGFGYFTASRAGNFNTSDMDHTGPNNPWVNASKQFVEKFGKDALDLATEFAHRNGKEMFLSLRFNDNHDAGSSWDKRNNLFSPFKSEHPGCMVGVKPASRGKSSGWTGEDFGGNPCCGWSAADFTKEKTRDFCRGYIREFCENYDLDGILFDFFRHVQLFRSVAWGGRASEEELGTMTDLMADLRGIADEVGKKRGRPFVLAMRVPDSVDYCWAIGIDLKTWLARKVVDFVVVGGYFQMEPWSISAELVHGYGMKCYASLDESRIKSVKGARLLPGRDDVPCWLARAAAAVAQGMDGVIYFNFEYYNHRVQQQVLSLQPRDLDGVDKLYFATYTGGGGYLPRHFLVGGDEFWKLGGLNPSKPVKLAAGGRHAFDLPIGDDFAVWRAKGKEPKLVVKLLTDARYFSDIEAMTVNGVRIRLETLKDGVFTGEVAPSAMSKGVNKVAVCAAAAVTLHDFSLSVAVTR